MNPIEFSLLSFKASKTYLEKQMRDCETQFKERFAAVGGPTTGKKSRS